MDWSWIESIRLRFDYGAINTLAAARHGQPNYTVNQWVRRHSETAPTLRRQSFLFSGQPDQKGKPENNCE